MRNKFNDKYQNFGDKDRVVLKFGNQFRTFRKDQIMDKSNTQFEEIVDNYTDRSGSERVDNMPQLQISMGNLDKSFFQLRTAPKMRVGHQRVKCKARYWKTNQPKPQTIIV